MSAEHNHAPHCCCHLELDQGRCPGCPEHGALATPSREWLGEQAGRAARGKDHTPGPWCQRFNCTSHLAGPYTPEETK